MDVSTRVTIISKLTKIWGPFQLCCCYTLKSILIVNNDFEYLKYHEAPAKHCHCFVMEKVSSVIKHWIYAF